MSKQNNDQLIELIGSLSKAEKRSFKLYAKRNSSQEELKFVQLFDYLEKATTFKESEFLQKYPGIKKEQLSNLKAHLYKQILASLRVIHTSKFTQLEVRELLDFAIILLNKGFYHQALKQLEKAGQLAKNGGYNILALEVVELEKSIETIFITKTLSARAEYLTQQSALKNEQVSYSVFFSNLSLELYALYLKVGFVRDEKENLFIKQFFQSKMIPFEIKDLGIEGRMYYYNTMVSYNHIIQNFVMCYKYARQWVNMFYDNPTYIESKKELFLRAQHNLLGSLFHLREYNRFKAVLAQYELEHKKMKVSENIEQVYLQYFHLNRLNQYYFEGNFNEGLKIVPEILQFIKRYESKVDEHQIVVFNYKIACLYFGSGDNRKTINYLNKVIQFKDSSIREDIQCFARILNLIAHFELGNDELVEYQVKSVYRFLIKIGELHGVQKEIFYFLRQLPFSGTQDTRKAFRVLHKKLVKLAQDPYEKRAFLYLDIISWLECKLENRSIQEVIQEKFNREISTGRKLYFPTE